eukprot:15361088-Ditylum_brightwellii.AAC.1
MLESEFGESKFQCIYCDDGMVVFNGRCNCRDITKWLERSQLNVNKLVGGDFFEFSIKLWNPPNHQLQSARGEENADRWMKKVKLVNKSKSPFLDMNLRWVEHELTFSVYRKENHQLKYVNKASCHCPTIFTAISAGVFTRLFRLTTMATINTGKKITDLYPDHAEALSRTDLLPKNPPTLNELYEQEQRYQEEQEQLSEEQDKSKSSRETFLLLNTHDFGKLDPSQNYN